VLGVICPQVQSFAFPSVELPGVPVSPLLQPMEVPRMVAQPAGVAATPPSAKLLRVHSVPSSSSLKMTVKQYWPQYLPRGTPLVTALQLDFVIALSA